MLSSIITTNIRGCREQVVIKWTNYSIKSSKKIFNLMNTDIRKKFGKNAKTIKFYDENVISFQIKL